MSHVERQFWKMERYTKKQHSSQTAKINCKMQSKWVSEHRKLILLDQEVIQFQTTQLHRLLLRDAQLTDHQWQSQWFWRGHGHFLTLIGEFYFLYHTEAMFWSTQSGSYSTLSLPTHIRTTCTRLAAFNVFRQFYRWLDSTRHKSLTVYCNMK